MATEIGTGTSYPITVPVGSDNADIQTALRYITYGIGGTPTSDSQITSNCIFGKMKLLAPKASPVFTGNGSIAGNFSIGGNLVVSGTIDNDQGTNATFNDKTLTIGNGNTTDADADENGFIIKGATDKKIIFQNGTGWESTENLNLATDTKTYQIAGTTVLSKDQVLGKTIGGTTAGDIVSTNGTQTLTNKTISSVSSGSNGMLITGSSAGSGLVNARHMVFSQGVQSTTGPSASSTANAFDSANDVLSGLEAAKLYRFKLKYFFSISYTSGVYRFTAPLTFSNAPASIKYSVQVYPQAMGTTITRIGTADTVDLETFPPGSSGGGSWVLEVDGYFRTHATLSSTLTPRIIIANSGGGSSTASVLPGSWIEIEKLGTSNQTLIAGNWA